jgi:hypothetical protein
MPKRGFRNKVSPKKEQAEYPTGDNFDTNRRSFLAQLGLAVLGGSLAACGSRVVNQHPDVGPSPGVAPAPDARADKTPPPQGEAPMPDARADLPVLEGGAAPMPDARYPTPDGFIGGGPMMPDARINKPDGIANMGDAPMPDARVDRR